MQGRGASLEQHALLTRLNHAHLPQAQRVIGRAAPAGLGLDVAVGYTCTLPFVGNLLADLPSGARAKKQAGGILHVPYCCRKV